MINLITSFTGLILRVFRFINKLLGFLLGFTGLWASILLCLFVMLDKMGSANPIINGSLVSMRKDSFLFADDILQIIALFLPILIIFPINCYRYYKKNKDSDFVKLVRSIFDPTYNAVLSGDNVPKEFLHEQPNGLYIGKKFGKFVCIKKEDVLGHILVVGGSRSGKSAGIILTNLIYSWRGSFIAIDIKGELHQKTKHIHYNALVLDPSNDEESIGFDPYELLRLDKEEIAVNARQIALSLIPMPADTKDPFWINSSRNILTSAIIHYFQKDFSFIETMEIILEAEIDELRTTLANSPYPEARRYINQVKKSEDKTISGIYSELADKCMIFGIDKKIMNVMTKTPRIQMRVFSSPDYTPPKLFVRIPHSKIEYYSNFVNLFFTYLMAILDMRPDGKGEKILIFFDEVAQFGHLHKLVSAVDVIASKNVILLLCMQSLSQFNKHYGEHDTTTMINNCDTRIILKAIDPKTQKYFSDMIGETEVERQSRSANFDIDTGLESGRGLSRYIRDIKIVRPESMAYLAEKREIILLTGKGYCKVRHVRYYEEDEFLNSESINGSTTVIDRLIKTLFGNKVNDTTKSALKQITIRRKRYEPTNFSIMVIMLFGFTMMYDESLFIKSAMLTKTYRKLNRVCKSYGRICLYLYQIVCFAY